MQCVIRLSFILFLVIAANPIEENKKISKKSDREVVPPVFNGERYPSLAKIFINEPSLSSEDLSVEEVRRYRFGVLDLRPDPPRPPQPQSAPP